jgi:polyphosphate kinase
MFEDAKREKQLINTSPNEPTVPFGSSLKNKNELQMKVKYLNRELSWLAFNARVLQEAADHTVPLVERMKFLGIFSNNLDEFFRVRVATVRRLISLEKNDSKSPHSPNQLALKAIHQKVIAIQKDFDKTYKQIQKDLEAKNIIILDERKIIKKHYGYLHEYFKEKVQPLLVPVILNEASPVPALRDKSIYLFVKFTVKKTKQKLFALIEVPTDIISRFILLPNQGLKKYLIYLDDVIRLNLPEIFQLFEPDNFESYIIKLTRDAELTLEGDVSDSFFEQMEKSLENRKKAEPVRFIYDENMPKPYLNVLLKKLKISDNENIIPGGKYHNFKDFIKFPNVGEPELEYPPIKRITHPPFEKSMSMLHAISVKDHLLFFPYQPFDYVIHFLREAAIDPTVKSIKITLYRLAKNSMIINALINAVRNGKTVTAILELQARFDEEANLNWSKKLTDAGVKLIFGLSGLKTHAKLVAITRVVKNKEHHFAYVATGNFNETTSKIYTDVALFTADPQITNEVNKVFHMIEKPYLPHTFKHLLVSPVGMRKKIVKLIENETQLALKGKPAYMRIKLNNLVDEKLIDLLYAASEAGVKIELFVRGICCLIPGVKGLSENIKAISIIDRFLEHSRIFVFGNDSKPLYFISSADWMMRNLDYRIEVACPIYDKSIKKEIDNYLDIIMSDNQKAREHNASMDNRFITSEDKMVRSQSDFFDYLKSRPDAIEIP